MQAIQVMVVEDERIVALHLRRQLLKLGYDVVFVAASGDQVLSQVATLRPDVILMDIRIEGKLDGIDTAARLPAGLPVIYLTAYSEEAVLARARATKPFGYLLKPFSERELHATIQMAIERRNVETALRESEEHLGLALDAAGMAAWEVDAESRRIVRMGRVETVFGCPGSDDVGGTLDHFLAQVPDEDLALLEKAYEQLLAENAICQVEFRNLKQDGHIRWLKVQGKSIPAEAERPRRIIGVVQDVTEQRSAEQRRRQAMTVFETTRDGLLILDTELRVITVNPGYCEMTGYLEEEVLGRRSPLLGPTPPASARPDEFITTLEASGRWRGEIQGRRKNGDPLPLLVNIAAVRGEEDAITHYVAACSDLTAIRKAEDELQHLAHYDPLTGLPNRLLAADRLNHAIEHCQRMQRRLGVLFVDLDLFKRINDSLGHSLGDEVLRVIAQRMRAAIRAEDTVARLGGDEFMVIIEKVDQPDDAGAIAMKVISAIAQPIFIDGRELTTSASVGISIFPDDGLNRESLIQAADTAMYAAKELGRGSCAFYTREMTARIIRSMAVDRDLRRGLAQHELELYYQPQISIATGAVIGLEALIRWQHGVKGLLGAEEVIPAAEKSGLIVEIGDWVVLAACRQAQIWRTAGLPPLRIAINVSPQQMRHGRLLQTVARALTETGMPPEQLEIEITESTLQNEEDCIQTLEDLKRLGVALAIDDFGTGYSCLSSLKTLPIRRLKIDQAFTRGIPDDSNDVGIAEVIIAMAHRLALDVVAEGVETLAQEEFLNAHGCIDVQGFLYARPMPASAVPDYVRKRRVG